MPRPVSIVLAIVLALAAVEALAYGWMHPAPDGLGQPVLCYVRQTDNSSSSSSSSTDNRKPTTDNSSSYTLLPDVVAKSLPSLRCTTGTAARIDRDDGVTIHLAFFEWGPADGSSAIEAFKHLPDECMGSIGMTLVEPLPFHVYQVGDESLAFDHTVFRDPEGVIVHTFKGTWVSGASRLLGHGLRGGADQPRQIRWKAAFKRFHPAYSCVAQGAVRGISNPDLAWQAFADAMLVDLKFETR